MYQRCNLQCNPDANKKCLHWITLHLLLIQFGIHTEIFQTNQNICKISVRMLDLLIDQKYVGASTRKSKQADVTTVYARVAV